MTKQTTHRPSAEERREQALEAAIHVFAEHGLHAAKTADIAKRAGISQPYIYALFEDKKALFLAAQERVRQHIKDAYRAAYRPAATPHESLRQLGMLYRGVLANPDAPRCLLQGHAASADPDIRTHMRDGFVEMFELIEKLTGADRAAVAQFMATGMLLNVATVLDVPADYVITPYQT